MAINFKPINEVPEISEMPEGAKVLVNADGTAKQIDASLVGGKGGGTVVYIKDYAEGSDGMTGSPCFDAELTQVMTQAEFLAACDAGPMVLYISLDGQTAYITPLMTITISGMVMSLCNIGENVQLLYTFADATA